MNTLQEKKSKSFANGKVYSLTTPKGYPVEVTDTFLPFYTKDAIGRKQNFLDNKHLGSRKERWLVGVSCMSGCPVRCKFCATGLLNKWCNLSAREIIDQVTFAISRNPQFLFKEAREHKINYTRMGEPFLNIEAVKEAINCLSGLFPKTHHYISTIGIKGSDFSWIKGNITLQISLHSLDEGHRNWLIPYKDKMSVEELGQIRTASNLKTTVNLTLVNEKDFDIELLKKYFDPKYFFIKLSPINGNTISEQYQLGAGIIKGVNLV